MVTLEEVKLHNDEQSCWVIVHGKVYDITDYLPSHPGGSAIILNYAGRDATAAYDEIHAPGIIEETLPRESCKGKIREEDAQKLRASREKEGGDVGQSRGGASSTKQPDDLADEPFTKPDLHSLISLADFEQVASHILSPKAWAFYSSASSDLVTHHQNADIFRRIMFRPRVMRNVSQVDIKTSILDSPSTAPFFVSPAAMARLAHKDGEVALAQACTREGIVLCISSNASYPLHAVIDGAGKGHPIFFQLYVNSERNKSVQLLRKAKAMGIRAVFVTVDAPIPGKREADERAANDSKLIATSPISGVQAGSDKKGGGIGRSTGQYIDASLTWEDIPWIQEASQLPIVIKGIQCAADARMALKYKCKGIFVSNHGGRQLDTTQPSLLTLLELHALCPEIFGRMEVYVDGGISRGSDILKCIALGATAVGLGRPFMYSLCYGSDGAEHLSQILKDELETSMKLCGITSLRQAGPDLLNTGAIDHLVPRSENHPWIKWEPKAKL